jgi:predicted RNA-binding protein with RPS1 domain
MSDQVEMVADQQQTGGTEAEANTPAPESEATAPEPVTAAETTAQTAEPAAEPVAEPAAEAAAEPATEAAPEPAAETVAEAQGEPAAAEAASPAAPAAATAAQSKAAPQDAEGGTRTVRVLHIGQQVTGTVKRVADFGAFVDIGVGRDGLIHISELSVRRVGKVTDVLAEGQEVTAWIKKLDRERNRISLTLIDPNTKTIRDLEKGQIVQGTVTRILPYGAFVDIGIGRDALLHVREMSEGYVAKPEDVVKVGDTVEARIIELSRRRGRVDLSLKGLRPEPEPVQPPAAQAAPQPAPEPEPEPEEPEEDFDDVDVLSPMELAFKRAVEAEGVEFKYGKGKRQGKRNRRERSRSLQDEIIARTLASSRK